ncbi:LuxR family transcriptional regulator [Sedimentitalea arenosa]|uniref:Autoinducer binding domain-containing protein n=1 Tax=Sedimentitalea arenosa TaxID=2798803 RepID=A0A8J7LZP9_9RHOB|nr:LuxR family transcriptional regulator [Arenibacterium arenosum]MBJ6371681.1 autoinducer binding domain-containing protein [Arenibacterium arenosum]
MELREYLHFVANAQSLEELWPAHTAQMDQFGFDRLIYGFTRFRTETSLGDPDDFTILTNHSAEYIDGFLHNGLYFHAPMLRWALENEGAGSWRQIYEKFDLGTLTPQQIKVVQFNLTHKVTAGYTISFNSVSPRSKGAISLAARAGMSQEEIDRVWADHGDDIHLMNNVAHLKILTLPYSPPNRSLTKRQREALEWVGDGKTTQDIAILMGLTAATVEKHLRLARESLSVETTAQAVLKAALHNQMFVMEG